MKPPEARNKAIGPLEGICVLSGIAFVISLAMIIAADTPKGETWQYWIVALAGIIFASSGLFIFVRSRRKDIYPDCLLSIPIMPYECEGVLLVPAVSPIPASQGGCLRYSLFYQNRYDANALIEFTYEPSPTWSLDIGPGEVGFVWLDGSVASTFQGSTLNLTVVASGRRAKGREIRFRAGSVLGNRKRERNWLLLGFAAGVAVGTKQAYISIPISGNSNGSLYPADKSGRIVIWKPGDSDEQARKSMATAFNVSGLSLAERK